MRTAACGVTLAPMSITTLAMLSNELADLTATPQRVDLRHRDGINVLYGDGAGRWVPPGPRSGPVPPGRDSRPDDGAAAA